MNNSFFIFKKMSIVVEENLDAKPTILEELEELDAKYKRERQAIILRNVTKSNKVQGRATDDRTKHLVKKLMLNRKKYIDIKTRLDAANLLGNSLRAKIGKNEHAKSRIDEQLCTLYPDRCIKCGAPHHDGIDCHDFISTEKDMTHCGNRFWWDVPFSSDEVDVYYDDSFDADEFYDFLEQKHKAYPVDPELLPKW